MSNIFAIIPARGGSKRIPDKNITLINNKPLISITIQNILDSGRFHSVYVSTDSAKIKEISLVSGALCPFERPQHLSDDFTTTLQVMKHALQEIDTILNHDLVMCVYPTAVLLSPSLFQSAIDSYTKKDLGQVFLLSVSQFSHPIERALRMDSAHKIEFTQRQFAATRTQDLQRSYFDAGQFCLGTKLTWLNSESIFDNAFGYEISKDSFIDIDYPEDLLTLRRRMSFE